MKKILMIIFIAAANFSQAQAKKSILLSEKGVVFISDVQLTPNQQTWLDDFNFEAYRKESITVVLVLDEGPMVEVLSTRDLKSRRDDVRPDDVQKDKKYEFIKKFKTINEDVKLPWERRDLPVLEVININSFNQ